MDQGIWSPEVPLYRAARATETCCFKRLKRLLRRVIVEQCRTVLPTLHDAQAERVEVPKEMCNIKGIRMK